MESVLSDFLIIKNLPIEPFSIYRTIYISLQAKTTNEGGHPMYDKQEFTEIVQDNAGWLLRYIRRQVRSDFAAEEVLQETFYRAYKAWEGYREQGQLRAWLGRIARNAAARHYNPNNTQVVLSLDADWSDQTADGGYFNTLASQEAGPDEIVVRDEFMRGILQLIGNLPERQRMAVMFRYVDNLSVAETSQRMGIPQATVKTNAFYGLQSLRKQMGVETQKTIKKGASKMTKCMDVYGNLFEYAKGYLTEKERTEVVQHLAACEECARVVSALKSIWPYLQQEFNSNKMDYFSVVFQTHEGATLGYMGIGGTMLKEQVDEVNQILDENNGHFTPDITLFNNEHRHNKNIKLLSSYINDGGKTEYEITYDKTHGLVQYTFMPKVYEKHWIYNTFYFKHKMIKKSLLAPKLYTGSFNNFLGTEAKSGLFIGLEPGTTNVQIKKGSGVLDLDGNCFVYAQRFTAEDEGIHLEFTFNK